MTEAMRKKSTSSDSELSDGWSLVDHSDTAPLMQRASGVTMLQPSTPHQPGSEPVSTQHGEDDAQLQPLHHNDETSSDAESVDILQDEPRIPAEVPSDIPFTHNISRVTTIHKGDGEAEECDELKLPEEARKKQIIAQDTGCEKGGDIGDVILSNSDSSSCDYLINSSNLYGGNEWLRPLIFLSSLVALILLLVSYTSLFFKEQAYSKSDGMIVLPDEDLSSLIAEMTLFKEENNRLKQELNMIKYEYGTNKKIDKTDGTLDIASDDEFIGLEVISDDSLSSIPEPASVKQPLTGSFGTTRSNVVPSVTTEGSKPTMPSQERRVQGLARLEENLKLFAKSLGLNDVVVSSYKIAKNLESIHSIVKNLFVIIDSETSPKKENKKFQLEQKLLKLHNKIDEDFKKSVEKVAKRINKFHDDFLSTYCRIKGDSPNKDNVDCGKFDKNQRANYQKSKEFDNGKTKKEGKKSEGGFIDRENSSSEEDKYGIGPEADNTLNKDMSDKDFKLRYKRSLDDYHHKKNYDPDSGEDHYEHHDKKDHHDKNKKYDNDKYYNKDKPRDGDRYKDSNYDKNKMYDKYKDYMNNPEEFRERLYGKDDYNKKETHHNKRNHEHHKDKHYEKDNDPYKQYKHNNQNYKENHHNKDNYYNKKESSFDSSSTKQLNTANNNWVSGNGESNVNFGGSGLKPSNQNVISNSKQRKEGSLNAPSPYQDLKSEGRAPNIQNENPEDSQKKNSVKKLEGKKSRKYGKVVGESFIKSKDRAAKTTARSIHNESIYSKLISGRPKAEDDGEWYLDLGKVRSQKRQRRATSLRQPGGWTFDRALVRDWCRGNSGSSLCLSFGLPCNYRV